MNDKKAMDLMAEHNDDVAQQFSSKQKVKCKLCSCEGIDSTVLCREHLDGYLLAVNAASGHGQVAVANWLNKCIKQQKGEDNGKAG